MLVRSSGAALSGGIESQLLAAGMAVAEAVRTSVYIAIFLVFAAAVLTTRGMAWAIRRHPLDRG